jgi:hypothetical protein
MNPKDLKHSYTPPSDGQGAYLFTSPTQGTIIHVTPGGWDVLQKFAKSLFSAGGWLLYFVSVWVEHGL